MYTNEDKRAYSFSKVVFAIPNTGAGARNYAPFERVFASEEG